MCVYLSRFQIVKRILNILTGDSVSGSPPTLPSRTESKPLPPIPTEEDAEMLKRSKKTKEVHQQEMLQALGMDENVLAAYSKPKVKQKKSTVEIATKELKYRKEMLQSLGLPEDAPLSCKKKEIADRIFEEENTEKASPQPATALPTFAPSAPPLSAIAPTLCLVRQPPPLPTSPIPTLDRPPPLPPSPIPTLNRPSSSAAPIIDRPQPNTVQTSNEPPTSSRTSVPTLDKQGEDVIPPVPPRSYPLNTTTLTNLNTPPPIPKSPIPRSPIPKSIEENHVIIYETEDEIPLRIANIPIGLIKSDVLAGEEADIELMADSSDISDLDTPNVSASSSLRRLSSTERLVLPSVYDEERKSSVKESDAPCETPEDVNTKESDLATDTDFVADVQKEDGRNCYALLLYSCYSIIAMVLLLWCSVREHAELSSIMICYK